MLNDNRGSKKMGLRDFAEEALGKESLKYAVVLPEGEDLKEWIAYHSLEPEYDNKMCKMIAKLYGIKNNFVVVDFYNHISVLFYAVEHQCTEEACPVMSASLRFQYLWTDSKNHPKPTKLPARKYIGLLMNWISEQINDIYVFPTHQVFSSYSNRLFIEMSSDNMQATTNKKQMSSKDYYFDSYAHFGIHEEMLKDQVRTNSYRDAIMKNKHLFKDKIVLDVGCGTGILSMFAASAGAKHVIGVDMSNIIDKAKLIVQENGFGDKITLLKGKMEEIEMPYKQVDIIISEWMGYFLLYESMLDTVLYARDKYLTEEGLVFPDKATMVIAGIEDGQYKEKKIAFWENVYGFKMTCIKEAALSEPLVDVVESDAIVTSSCVFREIDIKTVRKEDLAFTAPFKISGLQKDYMHAFIVWFDIWFSYCHKPVYFSTGPKAEYTHWKQTVLYTRDTLTISKNDQIEGTLTCKPNNSNPRDLDITIDYKLEGKDTKHSETCNYTLC
ncbi:hypothetical protein BB561_001682 [Smittium simulii]|uniref:Uncharacterized protein n=1 Tax=Smittium simulii TaxID=133385 RepID=A0A2T9YTH5_9FUNG|nr:hypothetical protein BB561_001682 [Smittium simulii]